MWNEQHEGDYPLGSAGDGYTSWRGPRPMGLDRTFGLDRPHVDGSGNRSERRNLVQLDGQVLSDRNLFSAYGKVAANGGASGVIT